MLVRTTALRRNWRDKRSYCVKSCSILVSSSIFSFTPTQISVPSAGKQQKQKRKTGNQVFPVREIPLQTNSNVEFPEFLQSETSRFARCVSAIFNPRGVKGRPSTVRPDSPALSFLSGAAHISWWRRCFRGVRRRETV